VQLVMPIWLLEVSMFGQQQPLHGQILECSLVQLVQLVQQAQPAQLVQQDLLVQTVQQDLLV
jgi:hypothetical protein